MTETWKAAWNELHANDVKNNSWLTDDSSYDESEACCEALFSNTSSFTCFFPGSNPGCQVYVRMASAASHRAGSARG